VYAIDQTRDGYLWIGTERGLVRFDGFNFKLFDATTPGGPALSHVLGLLADPDGSLWLRLRRPSQYVLQYRKGTFGRPAAELMEANASMAAMGRGADGSLLFWTLQGEGRAIVLRPGKRETIAAPPGFSRSPVLAITQTSDGDLWIGTRDAGLYRLHGGESSAMTKGLPDLKINALAAAGREVWVGTDAGVVRWDGTKISSDGVPSALGGVQALAMIADRDGNLWIGTNSHGLLRLNGRGLDLLRMEAGAPEAITALFEDREGILWVGNSGGLDRLHDSAFVTYSGAEGLPTDGLNPVFADRQGRTWFGGTDGGLWWFRGEQRGIVHNDGLDHDVVYSMDGGEDELWIGRQRGGLTRLRRQGDSVTTRTYTRADGLAQNSVYSVHAGRDGTVWAGTLSGGVTRIRDGRFATFTAADGLISNTVSSVLERSDGSVWFATPEGLSQLLNGRWRSYTITEGLPSADANCLLEDSRGILWVGTSVGLAFLRESRFQGTGEEIPSLRGAILGVAEDRSGSLWLSTAHHVLRVNREALLRGRVSEKDVTEYGLADGLRGREGVKRDRSMVADRDGRIWLSMNYGISVVDPARPTSHSRPITPQVESVLADGKPLDLSGTVHVPRGTQRITFTFAGLSFAVPERIRFRYRLDGFDGDWSAPATRREAEYTNLGSASYRFRVEASGASGEWNGGEAEIRFVVDPQVWQTAWFRAGAVVLFVVGGLAIYRFNLQRITQRLNLRFEERLEERTRIAQELHDTLLQGFLSASMQVHVVNDGVPAESNAKPILTRALQLMSQVTEEGRKAVQGLRSAESDSLDLEHAFANVQQEVSAHRKGSDEAAFRVVVDGEPRPLHPSLKDEVYRIGREALLNAFRHAKARNVELRLRYSARDLRMTIRDDGRGIEPDIVVAGRDGHWGLSGMRERADRIKSRLQIFSRPDSGTEIELSIPGYVAFADYRPGALAAIKRLVQPKAGPRAGL
jgi:signal transduction histidine kinase/streptogramin lyase